MNLRSLPDITLELKRLFGETPIDAAVKDFAERQLNRPRQAGRLLMEQSTGRILSAAAPVVAGAAAPRTMPVRDTSFHGEE